MTLLILLIITRKIIFFIKIASNNWLINTVGMLSEKLPEMLPEIIKTNIFIIKVKKYDFDLFECGMADLTKII